ncbi:hypothetical protein GCM10022215_21380 [Nocardioides fonticola]|uniref:DUF4234 domain-containing protein n=1 Tax=Nocardioides fonticola TaxID=450363 RepID=A0ABP7XIP2_9ACTN
MSNVTPPEFPAAGAPEPTSPAPPPMGAAPVPTPAPAVPAAAYAAPVGAPAPGAIAGGPIGKVRGTGVGILLFIVTFGIYGIVWYYKVHDEMKRHSNQGIGGGIALLLALFVGIVMPFLTASEVGGLYERSGKAKPVGGATGLWYLLGSLILIGPLVWYVKVNGALNSYWRSLGAS